MRETDSFVFYVSKIYYKFPILVFIYYIKPAGRKQNFLDSWEIFKGRYKSHYLLTIFWEPGSAPVGNLNVQDSKFYSKQKSLYKVNRHDAKFLQISSVNLVCRYKNNF